MSCRWQSLAGEQESAIAIDDGEGIAVEAVAGTEVALEVSGPDLVGYLHRRVGSAGMAQARAAAALGDQAVALEDVASGAAGRPFPIGVAFARGRCGWPESRKRVGVRSLEYIMLSGGPRSDVPTHG